MVDMGGTRPVAVAFKLESPEAEPGTKAVADCRATVLNSSEKESFMFQIMMIVEVVRGGCEEEDLIRDQKTRIFGWIGGNDASAGFDVVVQYCTEKYRTSTAAYVQYSYTTYVLPVWCTVHKRKAKA